MPELPIPPVDTEPRVGEETVVGSVKSDEGGAWPKEAAPAPSVKSASPEAAPVQEPAAITKETTPATPKPSSDTSQSSTWGDAAERFSEGLPQIP